MVSQAKPGPRRTVHSHRYEHRYENLRLDNPHVIQSLPVSGPVDQFPSFLTFSHMQISVFRMVLLWWPTCLQVHLLCCHVFTFATALSISAGCLQPMIHNSSWAHHLMSFWSFECDGLEFNFGIFKGKRLKGSLEIRRGVDLVPTIREQRNFSGLKSTLVTRRWS